MVVRTVMDSAAVKDRHHPGTNNKDARREDRDAYDRNHERGTTSGRKRPRSKRSSSDRVEGHPVTNCFGRSILTYQCTSNHFREFGLSTSTSGDAPFDDVFATLPVQLMRINW